MEVYAEKAFEKVQHRRVVLINDSTCGRDSCIVLAAEAFSQKSHVTGRVRWPGATNRLD